MRGSSRALRTLLAVTLTVVAFAAHAKDIAEPSITVGGSADELTVIAEGATLREVLEFIAHHQRLVVDAAIALDEPLEVAIVGEPLPQVIHSLLRDYNYTLLLDHRGDAHRGGHLWVHPRAAGNARRLEQAERFGVTGPDDIDAALKRLARGDRAARLEGAAVLTAWGGDDAFVALANALHDADPAVRAEALVGLADHFPAESPPLIGAALADAEPSVRESAIDALADIGSDAAVHWLAALLLADDAATRRRAVDALGDVDASAATRLLERALDDADEEVSQTAADYLAERR